MNVLIRDKIFAALSNSSEWFDFGLYGFFGVIFSEIFFPPEAHGIGWKSLLITYGIFFAGFCSRPIGALIFGHLGDRYGRIFVLKITPPFLILATAGIAFLPTYQMVGFLSPVLLLILRILQGIFISAEFSTNICYIYEISDKRKYLWASLSSSTATTGTLLSSFIAFLFYRYTDPVFLRTYGWRIAFLLSLPLGVLAFWARAKMGESPDFLKLEKLHYPLMDIMKNYKAILLKLTIIMYMSGATFYLTYFFVPVFLMKYRHFEESQALRISSLALLVHVVSVPLLSPLVKICGEFRAAFLASVQWIFLSIPCFYLISYGLPWQVMSVMIIMSLAVSWGVAVYVGLCSEISPPNVRCGLLSLSVNIGYGILSGMTTVIGLILIQYTNLLIAPAFYILFVTFLCVPLTYRLMKENGFFSALNR